MFVLCLLHTYKSKEFLERRLRICMLLLMCSDECYAEESGDENG